MITGQDEEAAKAWEAYREKARGAQGAHATKTGAIVEEGGQTTGTEKKPPSTQ